MAISKKDVMYLVVYIAAHSYNVAAVRPTKAGAHATAKALNELYLDRTYWIYECVDTVPAKEVF